MTLDSLFCVEPTVAGDAVFEIIQWTSVSPENIRNARVLGRSGQVAEWPGDYGLGHPNFLNFRFFLMYNIGTMSKVSGP